jgi:glycosyltransferase involved in cell wall biosynthesis
LAPLLAWWAPGRPAPGYLGGFPIGPNALGDMLYDLGLLHELGVATAAGRPVAAWVPEFLRRLDGPATDTFYSYRTAETLLRWGPFEENPLLADFTPAERENVAAAVDSTAIFDHDAGLLRHHPNNYYAVLGRCELARERLGLLEDRSVLTCCLEHLNRLFAATPEGFFDDSAEGRGWFDIYSLDTYLFAEPLWPLLDAQALQRGLRSHVRLLERLALENGASVAWGRSVGALSVCMTLELCAAALHHGLGEDPSRLLGLAGHAAARLEGWFRDGLVSAHRGRDPYSYRGPHRLLQMTLDILGKALYAASALRAAGDAPVAAAAPARLFPPRDELFAFDARGAGVWIYRDDHLAFQLPLVDAARTPDYAPWAHQPGLFENPVGWAPLFCGVPRLRVDGQEWVFGGRPTGAEKEPAGLALTHEGLAAAGGEAQTRPPSARRRARYRVEPGRLVVEETLSLGAAPEAVSLMIPEPAGRPLRVSVEAPGEVRQTALPCRGMAVYRSFWGEFERLHELHLPPARELSFTWTVAPRLRVVAVPAHHDYLRALYGAMPEEALAVRLEPQGRPAEGLAEDRFYAGADILHIGWPEHLFARRGEDPQAWLAAYLAWLAELEESPVRVVWTLHNRLPHFTDEATGRRLYEAWARLAEGVIHHSECGRERMCRELPFREDARHVVIPHGHYGAQMALDRERAALEEELELPPAPIRIGLHGRPQRERRIELVMEAFHACGREDLQLFVTALTPEDPVPEDPRIVTRPRTGYLPRETIAAYVAVSDALVSVPQGESYLTSGIVADAVGAGLPLIAHDWAFFREIMGEGALCFDGTREGLTRLFEELTPGRLKAAAAASRARQEAYAWPRLAQRTRALFEALGCVVDR